MSNPAPTNPPVDLAERRIWMRAKSEYERALAIAVIFWPALDNPPEVIQACAATLMIRAEHLRERGKAPQQGRSQTRVQAPACPECNKTMQAVQKKNPKEPDFRCPDNNCKSDGAHTTAAWIDQKAGGFRFSKKKAAPVQESYDDFPEALDDLDDDLPF